MSGLNWGRRSAGRHIFSGRSVAITLGNLMIRSLSRLMDFQAFLTYRQLSFVSTLSGCPSHCGSPSSGVATTIGRQNSECMNL